MKNYKILWGTPTASLILLILFGWSLMGTCVYAQSFDQSYLKWKAEQLAHDERLKQKQLQDHYLARPTQQSSSNDRIRLNQASLQQLQQLSGIGEKKAQAILDYRQKNGGFKSVDELQNIKGIGPKLLAKNRDRLSL